MDLLNLNSAERISEISDKLLEIRMLVLFGSRAKGTTHSKSDWDFGVFYEHSFNDELDAYLSSLEKLGDILNIDTEKIDLINLEKCSPLLGFNICKEGKLIYERQKGEFAKFQVKACQIYADTESLRARDRDCIKLWLQKSLDR